MSLIILMVKFAKIVMLHSNVKNVIMILACVLIARVATTSKRIKAAGNARLTVKLVLIKILVPVAIIIHI